MDGIPIANSNVMLYSTNTAMLTLCIKYDVCAGFIRRDSMDIFCLAPDISGAIASNWLILTHGIIVWNCYVFDAIFSAEFRGSESS
jgi:hypothetical protein